MCYTLEPVPTDPAVLKFSTTISDSFTGGALDVELTNAVDAINTESVMVENEAVAIQVEAAPIAVINAPANVQEGSSATVDASGSFDPNGDDLTFTWTQLSGSPVSVSANAASFSFEAPKVSSQNGIVSFELTVDDGNGNTDSEVVSIEIINKKSSGGSFGWLLLAAPLVWLRRRIAK